SWTWRWTSWVATLNVSGIPRASAVTAVLVIFGPWCLVLGAWSVPGPWSVLGPWSLVRPRSLIRPRSLVRTSSREDRRRQQRDNFSRERLWRERARVDARHSVRSLADQTIGDALVNVEREADPAFRDPSDTDADRQLVAKLRGRSKSRLERRPRHEDVQPAQQRRSIAAEPPVQLLFGVLEVAEEDTEPHDARRIGVGPPHAEVDMMVEGHRPI